MKSIFMILTMVLAFVFHAEAAPGDVAGYTKVPEAQVEDYKQAISAGLTKNPDSVNNCDSTWVYQTLQYVNDVLVSNGSSQPLLITNTYYALNNSVMRRLVIYTTADLKNVTRVMAQTFELGEVNQGDLAHPVIVEDYVLRDQRDCSRH